MDLKNRLTSRKLWLAIVAALVVFLNEYLGWDLEMEKVWTIVGALLTFVVAEGARDTVREMKK